MEKVVCVESQSPDDYANEEKNYEVYLPGFDTGFHYKHEDRTPKEIFRHLEK